MGQKVHLNKERKDNSDTSTYQISISLPPVIYYDKI